MVENLDLPSPRKALEDFLEDFFSGYFDEFKVVPHDLSLTFEEYHQIFTNWDGSNGAENNGIIFDEFTYDEYGTRAIIYVEYTIEKDENGEIIYRIREVNGIREKVEEDEEEEEE
jgi:hypothetical protein